MYPSVFHTLARADNEWNAFGTPSDTLTIKKKAIGSLTIELSIVAISSVEYWLTQHSKTQGHVTSVGPYMEVVTTTAAGFAGGFCVSICRVEKRMWIVDSMFYGQGQ